MKKTIFNELHKQFGAKMVEFAGFEMPIQYKNGIIHEHKVVREKVGVFDVSHMGEFDVQGLDSLAFIQKITVNDASKLVPGKVQYSAMTRPDGCIVDDLLVYCLAKNHYMLVVNGANVEKDYAWCKENIEGFDLLFTDISNEINLLAVQGPESMDVLQELTDVDMSQVAFYTFTEGKLAGVDMIISRTGYTGELGYELYFRGDFETAKKIWDGVFAAGEKYGIEPVGLGCRDTLRLEKCYMLYGNDIDETTNPIEAGLGWITKPTKGSFNGSDVIVKVKEEGPKRKLVGFFTEAERFIPRHRYKIYHDGKEVGYVTSGNISPSLGRPIALGYVPTELAKPGTKIDIEARKKFFAAEIVKTPFLK